MTVRVASAGDAHAIEALYGSWLEEAEAFRGDWSLFYGLRGDVLREILHQIDDPNSYVAVASGPDGVIAYLIASTSQLHDPEDGAAVLHVRHLVVANGWRRLGVGGALLDSAIGWGEKRGASRWEMTVLPGHRGAKNFCEQHGFKARALVMASSEPASTPDRDPALIDAEGPSATGPASRPVLCAGVALFDGGRLLLVRRLNEPAAGLWSLPGGRALEGESLDDAARRELLEETGLEAEITSLVGVAQRRGPASEGISYLICNFLATSPRGEGRAASDATEIGWFDLEDLPSDLSPGLEVFLRKVFASGPAAPVAIYDPIPVA